MRSTLFGINTRNGDGAIPLIRNANVTAMVEARDRPVTVRGIEIPSRHTLPIRWSGSSRLRIQGPGTIRTVRIDFDVEEPNERSVETRFNDSYWSRGGWLWEYKGLETRRLRGRPIYVSHPEHTEDAYWAREIAVPWAPIIELGQRATQSAWQKTRSLELAGKGNRGV